MPRSRIHPSLAIGLISMAVIYFVGDATFDGWSTHVSIPLGIGGLLAGYAACIGPWRARLGGSAPVPREQWLCFVTACLILFVSLTGPIHDISDSYLFSGHMVQHLLITLLVPPMLLIGTPDWLVRRALRPAPLARLERLLTTPLVAYLLFSGTVAVWHLPALYNSTLIRLEVHVAEHLLFIVTAVIGWWPVLAPARELRPKIAFQMVYLLLLPFPMKIVGMLITLSDSVLYPAYAIAPRIWGLDPLADQQIGGIMMWVPAGFVFWVTLAAHFFRWYGDSRSQDLGEINVVPLTRERVL